MSIQVVGHNSILILTFPFLGNLLAILLSSIPQVELLMKERGQIMVLKLPASCSECPGRLLLQSCTLEVRGVKKVSDQPWSTQALLGSWPKYQVDGIGTLALFQSSSATSVDI